MTFDDIYNKSIKFPVYACQKISWESTGKRIIFLTSIMFQLLPCLVVFCVPFNEANRTKWLCLCHLISSFIFGIAKKKSHHKKMLSGFSVAHERTSRIGIKKSSQVECHAQAFAHLTDNQFRSIHNFIIISLN